MHLKPSTYFTVVETEARQDGQCVSGRLGTGISKISARKEFGYMFFCFNVPSFRLAIESMQEPRRERGSSGVVFVLLPVLLLNLTESICRLAINEFNHNCCCELPAEYLSGQNSLLPQNLQCGFQFGEGKRQSFPTGGVTFAHTIPGGHMASTTHYH